MTDLSGFQDSGRSVLRMRGSDAAKVLQDIVTNDVGGLDRGAAVYAALLTPQGKYLFDFFLVRDGDTILIDAEAARAEALMGRIRMYCLRRDASIEAAETPVTLIWGGEMPEAAGAIIVADPRDAALGWRAYGAVGGDFAPADRAAYDALRLSLGVPEGGRDLLPEETYILEAGFERLHGVDFKKGCYVGQEVTARMKHKTELRKGLVTVQVEGEAPIGTEITANGKVAGKLLSHQGGIGLAHLRFDRAAPEMQAGDALVRYEP
ncbi:folate-binding protein YgfZ [Rhodobacteraceae bacterium NNCM2]|nr:folate-binding protein YgfZ [Coraliihabitans acroporae]